MAVAIPIAKTKRDVEVGKLTPNQARVGAVENLAEEEIVDFLPLIRVFHRILGSIMLPIYIYIMHPSLLNIHIFIESIYSNEDFNHEIEHRFFEHQAIADLEDDAHTTISAYAHVTGILFNISTIRYTPKDILQIFSKVLDGEIPEISKKERTRFAQEAKERSLDETRSFVESCPIRKELGNPVTDSVWRFSDFISRISIVTRQDSKIEYQEKRMKKTDRRLSIVGDAVSGQGNEFHLIVSHEINSLEDLAYQAIYNEYVRHYLKKAYTDEGKIYTVWANAYFESGYAYAWYYWYTDEQHRFSFRNENLLLNSDSFSQHKKAVFFDTILSRDNQHYALYTILGVDPNEEFEILESVTYEGFQEFTKNSVAVNRLYCR